MFKSYNRQKKSKITNYQKYIKNVKKYKIIFIKNIFLIIDLTSKS